MMQPSIEQTDLKILTELVKDSLHAFRVLEIGMHRGYSLKCWDKSFTPKQLIGLEIDSAPQDAWNGGVFATTLWNTDSHKIESLERVKQLLEGSQVDFLFIDGDHSYDGVVQDFELYSPLVRPNGIIAFHDVCYISNDPASPCQVKPLWEDLKLQYPYVEIRTSQNSTGIGVIWKSELTFLNDLP